MLPLADVTWSLGLLIGVAVGVAGLVVGLFALKFLAKTRVAWWPSLMAPALTYGPALGLLVGTFLHQGEARAVLFWDDGCVWTARLAWSLLGYFGATAAYGIVRSYLTSRIVTEELGIKVPEVFLDMGRFLVWVVMAFVVVGVLWARADLFSALFAGSAILTFVVGLALQDTIKNFISAWAIVGEGVYNIGDWVWIGEDEGEVIAISRRTTKIRTRTSDLVAIPNSMVTASKVRNESRPSTVHAELVYVTAAYDAPPNRVRDVLRRAVLEVPKVLASPAPMLRLHKFADSGIDYQVKFWVNDIGGIHDIKSDVMIQIWYHFQRDGIEFPYPVREIRRRAVATQAPEDTAHAVLARLKSNGFFGALPEDLLTLLARDAGLVQYGAGERVVQHREAGDTCYVVDAGRLAVLVTDGLVERQVAILKPGDLFGEMSLLTGEPRSATVRALDDSRLVAVGSSGLRGALERSPDLATRLAEVVTMRREGLTEARAALDAAGRARMEAQVQRLGDLIKRFFRLPGSEPIPAPTPPPGAPPAADPRRVAAPPPGA